MNIEKNIYNDFATVIDYPINREELSSACQRLTETGFDVKKFWEEVKSSSLEDLQTGFCETFDFSEDAAPYAAYQAFEKEAERSAFMCMVSGLYDDRAYPRSKELPDYIPQMLKFLGGEGFDTAGELLPAIASAAAKIATGTKKRENKYAPVYKALHDFAENRVNGGKNVLARDI